MKKRPKGLCYEPVGKPAKRDWSTCAGAEEMARQIEEYWHARGYASVKAWVDMKAMFRPLVGKHAVYPVRDNLIAGMPPDWNGEQIEGA